MSRPPLRTLRIAGVIGTLAAVALVASDLLLLYRPLPVSELDVYAVAPHISWDRVRLAYRLAVPGFPLALLGLWHVYLGLRPAGRWLSVPPLLLTGFGWVTGGIFHGVLAAYLLIIRGVRATAADQAPFLLELESLLTTHQTLFLGAVVAGTLWLFVAIVSGRSRYPRWAALVSPAVLLAALWTGARLAPPELAGALLPAGPNLSAVLFLGLSTYLLWDGGER